MRGRRMRMRVRVSGTRPHNLESIVEYVKESRNVDDAKAREIATLLFAETDKISHQFVDMSYGELGRIVEDMMIYAKERKITSQDPIAPSDLINWARRVRIDDETCVWWDPAQSMEAFLHDAKAVLVRSDHEPHPEYA